jgi:hypothetical protein
MPATCPAYLLLFDDPNNNDVSEISGSHGGEYEDVFWDTAPLSLV